MAKKESTRGSCLCNGIKIEITGGLEREPEACHCSQCRKQTGHFLAAVNVKRDALNIDGEEKIAWYESSEQVRRGFCTVCGSTLFWDAYKLEGYDYIAVAMGLLDEPSGTRISKHTFVVDKGDYYELEDDIPQVEGF